MRKIAFAVFSALFLLGGGTAAAAELPLRSVGAKHPLGNERLSNERTVTRWAHTNLLARVWSEPSTGSKVVGRLRFRTEDGPPEAYLALSSVRTNDGQVWIRIRLPARPNGQKGWVRREALGSFGLSRDRLVINRKTLRAKYYRRGKVVLTTPVGVGKHKTPTPRGKFYVREKLKALKGGTLYGPWAIGTSAYSVLSDWPGGGVVGVHGTDQPELIPGRPSHGCVRMPNRKIRRLARLISVGTPIRII